MNRADSAITLRTLAEQDCAVFARLIRGHRLFEPYRLTPARLAGQLSEALKLGHGLIGAEAAGQPAGLTWYLTGGTFGHGGYLRLMVVASGQTGRGIGTLLMQEVEGRVFAVSRELFLLVNVANAAAQAFYEAKGYVRVGRLDDFAQPGQHEYIYRKRRQPR